jgi:hypothetical protein
MEKKYRILRIVATIWKVLAWFVLAISVLGGCGSLALALFAGGAVSRGSEFGIGITGGIVGGLVTALILIFIGVLYFLSLYAFSELVDVLLALEENTRATAEQLKNMQKT